MHYTYLYLPSDSMTFQGKKPDALKLAETYHMRIKKRRNGWFLLVKDPEAMIYERDESNQILDQVDPFPYIRLAHPKFVNITEKRIQKLVDELNKQKVSFDELCKAAS